jgi:hypothetical protein
MAGLMSAATAADLVILDFRQSAGNEILYHGFDLNALIIVVYIDPDLPESHEGPHADAADHQGADPVFGKQVDRDHAAALDVFLVLKDGYFFDLAVFHVNQGEHVAMAEMSCSCSV